MSVLDTPDWLQQYVDKWQKRLFLDQWRIKTKLALAPNNDVGALAVCETVSNIRSATLTFRADAQPGKEMEETAIHEMLHVSHAFTDMAIWSLLSEELPDDKRAIIYRTYTNEMERFIDGLSKILWELEQPQPKRITAAETKENAT